MKARIAVVLTFLTMPGVLTAQIPAEYTPTQSEHVILRMVAEEVGNSLDDEPSSAVPVLSRAVAVGVVKGGGDGASTLWAPAVAAELAEALGGRVAEGEQVYVCEGRPPRCTLSEGDVLVAIGVPELEGDEGTVPVTIARQTGQGADAEAFETTLVLRLERADGDWQIAGPELIRAT